MASWGVDYLDSNRKVGVLGGTFDPVHIGHLRIALEVRERLRLDVVKLVPLYNPPHRSSPKVASGHRLAMLHAALPRSCGLEVDEVEFRRQGTSYTIDTLTALRATEPTAAVCLIVGQDAFLKLPTWRRWRELVEMAHIVVVRRIGADGGADSPLHPELQDFIAGRRCDDADRLNSSRAGKVFWIDCPTLEISSTGIRNLIAAGRTPRFLVPEGVLNFIDEHKLYRT